MVLEDFVGWEKQVGRDIAEMIGNQKIQLGPS